MSRGRALFICGSLNQTTQLHQVARHLDELDAFYTPFYCDGAQEIVRKLGWAEFTIAGRHWRKVCLRYLRQHRLATDFEGRRGGYDLVVTCTDLMVPANVQRQPLVVVQEGITDPPRFWYHARRVLPFIPRVFAGTAWSGTSNLYDRLCVASEGYRDLFVSRGADPAKVVVTGIPNFDDCARYLRNDFPRRGYVLICTSDARETFKVDNRRRFIASAVAIAAGRPLVFKLHPNEDWERARREIARSAPGAEVYTTGSAEEMVANADALVCQYSTLAFVGLALGKEVHSYYPLDELRRLAPIQGGHAAVRIAEVCRKLLNERTAEAPALAASLVST
jgi:hypothetical protein